jgi:glutamate racemase
MSKIGVFDSGIGGLSVANAIEKAFPKDTVLFVNDTKNVPYGSKTYDQLKHLVIPILAKLEQDGCDVIVVACNTISCTVLKEIKPLFHIPLIGVVPMIKPAAALTQSKKIAVCATPATLGSTRYAELVAEYGQEIEIYEPDCSQWALMIEHDEVDRAEVARSINDVCEQGVDVIVLGCTHYHWIENIIEQESAGRAHVLQPEPAIIAEVRRVLGRTL